MKLPRALESDATRLAKAMQLLADIEELTTHIEDAAVLKKWILRIAASRHQGVFNVRFAKVLESPLTGESDIPAYREKVGNWQRSLASFVGEVMKERPSSTDEQLAKRFAEWEAKNPIPAFK